MTTLSAAPPDARTYHVPRADRFVPITARWDEAPWRDVEPAEIDLFLPRSDAQRPRSAVKMLYDDAGLYQRFTVEHDCIRAHATQRQGRVWRDSCVEFFVQPGEDPARGYFNFEINCAGTPLCHHRRVEHAELVYMRRIADHWFDRLGIHATMPARIEPEWHEPASWALGLFIPFELFEAHVGPLGDSRPAPGVRWRANWNKITGECSKPHWATWSPLGDGLGFHQPENFGTIIFQ